ARLQAGPAGPRAPPGTRAGLGSMPIGWQAGRCALGRRRDGSPLPEQRLPPGQCGRRRAGHRKDGGHRAGRRAVLALLVRRGWQPNGCRLLLVIANLGTTARPGPYRQSSELAQVTDAEVTGMGLMDRVKAQASSLAQQANQGMAKLDNLPAQRRADALLRSL